MDPLSITASAIAILQLTQSIIIGTNNFYKSARDCPAEIRGLLDELMSFEKVLENLQLMVEKANGIHVSKPFSGVRDGDSVHFGNCSDAMWVFRTPQSMDSRQSDLLGTRILLNILICSLLCLSNDSISRQRMFPQIKLIKSACLPHVICWSRVHRSTIAIAR